MTSDPNTTHINRCMSDHWLTNLSHYAVLQKQVDSADEEHTPFTTLYHGRSSCPLDPRYKRRAHWRLTAHSLTHSRDPTLPFPTPPRSPSHGGSDSQDIICSKGGGSSCWLPWHTPPLHSSSAKLPICLLWEDWTERRCLLGHLYLDTMPEFLRILQKAMQTFKFSGCEE